MDTIEFLEKVVTTPTGWFCLSIGGNGVDWYPNWFHWPEQKAEIAQKVASTTDYNVYFSPHLFEEKFPRRALVLPSRTICADLDEADIDMMTIRPTLLVKTSEGRHQGFWILREDATSLDELEIVSKRLTYFIDKCDRSGWPLGHMFRIPPSYNWKYPQGPQNVEVKDYSGKEYSIAEFLIMPEASIKHASFKPLIEWELPTEGPRTIMQKYQGKIPPALIARYDQPQPDRSVYMWQLECRCFSAGMTREEVFVVAKASVNNKFKDLRHNADIELAKDVMRAEEATLHRDENPRSIVMDVRSRTDISAPAKRAAIFDIIRAHMRKEGIFFNLTNEVQYYVPTDIGRPIRISQRSEYLRMYMDIRYGINASESDYDYLVEGLLAYTLAQPPHGNEGVLSYYDQGRNSLLLHSGKKNIWRISKDVVEMVPNGTDDIVFLWTTTHEPFTIYPRAEERTNITTKWYDAIFDSSLDALVLDWPRDQALAILRVWFHFMLFRSAAISRPLLTLIGQPGSGKSTLFRKLYALLYGRGRSLSSVTVADDFDHAVSTNPLVVFDNVDTYERWLPDRLALSAATSDIVKRRLYTDSDTVTIRRHALIALTSHNPKFAREDVADRLIMLNFQRRSYFGAEGEIVDEILNDRDLFWAQIANEVRDILNTPKPAHEDIPQFRIEDFARLGIWIAKGLHVEKPFTDGLNLLKNEQTKFVLEEEVLLVEAIQNYLARSDGAIPPTYVALLYQELRDSSSDARRFEWRYKNATQLARKLWSLHEQLRQIFDIEVKDDKARRVRMWSFSTKDN